MGAACSCGRRKERNEEGLRKFTLQEVRAITENYDKKNKIGEGGFGEVFRGEIVERRGEQGVQVAVKKLKSCSSQGFQEFLVEILILSQISHPNIVKLLGYCTQKDNGILVYELMEGGSLSNALEDSYRGHLDFRWEARVKVARDCAAGLKCLHDHKIIHRDIKASNVLLDQEFNAKVTDLGLVRMMGETTHRTLVTSRILGTDGYIDPNYRDTGHLSARSDVYAFGVLLMELVTGQRIEGTKNLNWVRDMRKRLENTDPDQFVDHQLEGIFDREEARKLADMARQATLETRKDRPDMATIESILNEMVAP